MIQDKEFLHGAAFLRLINQGQCITVSQVSSIDLSPSIYIIKSDQKVSAVLFKISTKPRSAWSFSFTDQEDKAIDRLKSSYRDINFFVALICHKDGICCLSEDQLLSVFDHDHKECIFEGQRISVSRKSNSSYSISGPKRLKMQGSVPQNAWPKLVI